MSANNVWQAEMQRRGLVNEHGWFVHRLWTVAPVSIRTSHSEPLPTPTLSPGPADLVERVVAILHEIDDETHGQHAVAIAAAIELIRS